MEISMYKLALFCDAAGMNRDEIDLVANHQGDFESLHATAGWSWRKDFYSAIGLWQMWCDLDAAAHKDYSQEFKVTERKATAQKRYIYKIFGDGIEENPTRKMYLNAINNTQHEELKPLMEKYHRASMLEFIVVELATEIAMKDYEW